MGDRVAVLKDGLLQQVDTPRRMYDHPDNVFVAGFIGSPAMNLLDVPVTDGGVKFGDASSRSRASARRGPSATPRHRRRPARGPRRSPTSGQGLAVTVDVVEELGADAYVYGSQATWTRSRRRGARQAVHRPRRRPPSPGEGRDRLPHARAGPPAHVLRRRPACGWATDRVTPDGVRRAGGTMRCRPSPSRGPDTDGSMTTCPCSSPRPAPTRHCSTCRGQVPLEDWPADQLAALPRGISRHVVRFVRLSGARARGQGDRRDLARREYDLLRSLDAWTCPASSRSASSPAGRRPSGQPLDACLLTRHLQFSLPYRALFSARRCAPTPRTRLIDALAVLLVRLHLAGFYWGDVLAVEHAVPPRRRRLRRVPRRRRDRRAARRRCQHGQREHDLEIARVNIAGELMDLEAGGLPRRGRRPDRRVGDAIVDRYRELWARADRAGDGSRPASAGGSTQRIRRLNDLGFDVDELAIVTDLDGTHDPDPAQGRRRRPPLAAGCCGSPVSTSRRTRPAGCSTTSTRTAPRPTGRTRTRRSSRTSGWPSVYEPVVRAVPRELRGKLEPAELFHEVLEHRWYLSERAGTDVPIRLAVARLRRPGAAGQAGREGGARRRHRRDAGRGHVRRLGGSTE